MPRYEIEINKRTVHTFKEDDADTALDVATDWISVPRNYPGPDQTYFVSQISDGGTIDWTAEEKTPPWEYRDEFDEELTDGVGFADPTGRSALRAATPTNPRIYPCPTCGKKNKLTLIDTQRGYQCDRCAERLERGGW